MCRARSWTRVLKSSFLATKSVSQFTSTRTPIRPSPWMYDSIIPCRVSRSARFPALTSPLWRRISWALPGSPPASSSAFFASIMPTPVSSRRCFTSLAETAMLFYPLDRLLLGRRLGRGRAIVHCSGNELGHEHYGFDGVIVGRNDIINFFRIAIGINEPDYFHSHAPRFYDRDFIMVDVHHKHGIRKLFHVFDALEQIFQFGYFALDEQSFLFDVLLLKIRAGLELLQAFQFFDGFLDGFEICKSPAQPANRDIGHTARLRGFFDFVFGLAFGPHKHYRSSGCGNLPDIV